MSEKWFQYGKVTPPLDNNPQELMPIEIDLYSQLEKDDNGNSFYWVQSYGDTITLTNFNWFDVEGNLFFDLEKDPCQNLRRILIGLPEQSSYIYTAKQVTQFSFNMKIKSNSSIFINIIPEPGPTCYLKNTDNRNFSFKISNLTFNVTNDFK